MEWEEIKESSVEMAAVDMGNELYQVAVKYFRAMEISGKIFGNGYYMAQDVVLYAREIMEKAAKK
jgi:hypothetical protein